MGSKRLATGLAILSFIATGQVCVCSLPTSAQGLVAQPPSQTQSQSPSQANNVPDSSILNSTVAGPFQHLAADVIDPVTGQLLWQTSHKPELMNVAYLQYYLGPPDKQSTQIGAQTQAYYWYDPQRRLVAELYQESETPGQVVESMMRFPLPQSKLDTKLLKKTLGPPVRFYFDSHKGDPTEMYYYAPHTTLAMASPPNTFAIRNATITYIGPPLPQPAPEDMQLAHDSWIARTESANIAAAKVGGKVSTNWSASINMARLRVQAHPDDAAAHVNLADTLKQTGNVHEAIGEYKYALALDKYDDPLRKRCIQGLKDLYVLPMNYGSGAQGVAGSQPVQFSNNGQPF